MKFLVVRFSSIGDIVLTTPVVRCLKKQVATAQVHYLTKRAFRPIIESNPYVDKAYYIHHKPSEVIEELEREDYDYIIDLHHNIRSLKVKKALGKPAFSFNKLNIEKWLRTALKINRLPDQHIVDRYLETVAEFGVRNDGAGLDYFVPEQDAVKESDIPASHHAGYIGVVIGAALNTKKLPLEKLKELCGGIHHPLILLGGKEDREEGEEIAAVDPSKIYNACGKFSINESADLVRRSRLIITHDTGLMHIATAFNKPVISIWGNTIPQFGMYPYYGDNYINATAGNGAGGKSIYDMLEVHGLSCRPCSKIGYKKCPRGHFKCMKQQSLETIINKVEEKIGRK